MILRYGIEWYSILLPMLPSLLGTDHAPFTRTVNAPQLSAIGRPSRAARGVQGETTAEYVYSEILQPVE